MARGWWSGGAQRGDAARLEAFSDGVLAIAITLLILEVRVEPEEGESLAHALGHAMPQIVAYAASFLQIGIMWANHHALFRTVRQVDQILLLANLLLLGFVSFLPLPTRLVAEHTAGADGRTAMLLYGGTLTACAVMFNAIWWRLERAGLLLESIDAAFRRDVGIRYVIGVFGYLVATLLCLIAPWLTLLATALLALVFVLGPSPRPATAAL
ncbi:TMEM175 family protein [Labedaea rhizosphaerae]|uniref:Putative membrane protein n=1 Tax=Labedaea rhizosphaerae TaxID=598644 RepID=A0A4V3CYG1_LABRH|nr:TMEM175 family protein [Labedaea rhizosphaerae]TDP93998.1 putative membrane protein [Labedaea rhizosphaerae]